MEKNVSKISKKRMNITIKKPKPTPRHCSSCLMADGLVSVSLSHGKDVVVFGEKIKEKVYRKVHVKIHPEDKNDFVQILRAIASGEVTFPE